MRRISRYGRTSAPACRACSCRANGPFRKQRTWYKQFYNPRAQKDEYLKQVEGIHIPRGMQGFPPLQEGETLAESVAAMAA